MIVTGSKLSTPGVTRYDFSVALTLNPDVPIRTSSYGPMCGMKLAMSGVVNPLGHTVSGTIWGGFAGHRNILIVGVQRTAIPFPGTPCTLLVNPAMTATFRILGGISVFELKTPGRIDGLIYVQAVSAQGGYGYTSIRMSNGIKVDGG